MLNDFKYDKIKLLNQPSCICCFLEKHSVHGAQKSGENHCIEIFNSLKNKKK